MSQNIPQLYALSLKINIDLDSQLLHNLKELQDGELQCTALFWETINHLLLLPFHDYLSSKNVECYGFTSGLHTMGKKQKEHIHFHLSSTLNFEKDLPNILTNYKYYYHKKFREQSPELYDMDFFKKFKHSHQVKTIQATPTYTPLQQVKRFHAYCFKECIDETQIFKANHNHYMFPPAPIEELIALGSGLYLDAIAKYQKQEQKEELKMEKWGHFCSYMDDLFETPTYQEMKNLRGICILALDYFRKQPERTSVNAVITMCKDYSFKRNIWTNDEILDKYGIV